MVCRVKNDLAERDLFSSPDSPHPLPFLPSQPNGKEKPERAEEDQTQAARSKARRQAVKHEELDIDTLQTNLPPVTKQKDRRREQFSSSFKFWDRSASLLQGGILREENLDRDRWSVSRLSDVLKLRLFCIFPSNLPELPSSQCCSTN